MHQHSLSLASVDGVICERDVYKYNAQYIILVIIIFTFSFFSSAVGVKEIGLL